MATCPMNNHHCEAVVTVDLRSCVSMGVYRCHGSLQVYGLWVFKGVYGCLQVFGYKLMATYPMKTRHCEAVVTGDLRSCVSMGVYGCHGSLQVYGLWVFKEVYGCLWVFGCKSMATCAMKNRQCEAVVTVDLSSCVSMGVYRYHGSVQVYGLWVFKGVYGCLQVFGCKLMATYPMKNRHCEAVVTVDLRSCVSMGVYGCHGSLYVYALQVFKGVHG